MQALSIFDVTKSGLDYSSSQVLSHINQIAKICKVCPNNLLVQFQDIHPRAVALTRSLSKCGDVNKVAWKTIHDKIHGLTATARHHPMDALVLALRLYFVFGISSSGVEQNFSKSRWGFGNRRLSAFPETEEYCLRLIMDLPNHDVSNVITLAQKVWSCCYGPVRQTHSRISLGVLKPRKRALADGMVAHSETDFIKNRRKAASALVDGLNRPGSSNDYAKLIEIDEAEIDQPGWLDAHTKELGFQKQKLRARKIQAFTEHVVDADGDATLVADAAKERRSRIIAQRARIRKDIRTNAALRGATGVEAFAKIVGGLLHVDDNLASHALLQVMENTSMRRVEVHNADVFVVEHIGRIGQRITLASALRGGYHVTPDFIISKGTRGVASKYRCMASISRVIYVSQAVSTKNKNTIFLLNDIIANCAQSKINIVINKDWECLKELKKKYNGRTKSTLIAIIRTNEKQHPANFLIEF